MKAGSRLFFLSCLVCSLSIAAVLAMTALWPAPLAAQQAANRPVKVHISAGVAAGLLLHKTAPLYPPIAKAARVSGTVVLEATISETGSVENLRVISGPAMLQEAALEAVRTWRYRPYLLNGRPVEVLTTVNVIFTLSPEGGAPDAEQAQANLASAEQARQQMNQESGAEVARLQKAGQQTDQILAQAASASGQAAAAPAQQFRVGGVSIAIPPPAAGMVEVGEDNRPLLDPVVPDSNRLVAAFLLAKDVGSLRSGVSETLTPYALVEVLRSGEFTDIGASDFKDLADSISQQLGTVLDSSVKESEEEFNRRMKAMNLDNVQISYGKPVMLGTLFTQDDAFAFGMMAPVTSSGKTAKMIVGTVLLRVRNRVLFVYFYSVYKDAQTLDWIRNVSQQWTGAILAANQE